jgi:DNA-binding NtrC family response regulator
MEAVAIKTSQLQTRLILVIEDDDDFRFCLQERIKQKAPWLDLICVGTLESARTVLEHYHSDLNAIVIDGCVPGHHFNTGSLIKEIRRRHPTLPLIGSSGAFPAEQRKAGCNYSANKDTDDIIRILRRIFSR